MTDNIEGEEYGHEGPIEADTWNFRGDVREIWVCRTCSSSVPRDKPELFADADCDRNKAVKEGAAEKL